MLTDRAGVLKLIDVLLGKTKAGSARTVSTRGAFGILRGEVVFEDDTASC